MAEDQKLLILSLGRRGGSVRYGKSIIEAMSEEPKEVFVSRFCLEKLPRGAISIPTYRNKIEFIFSSMTVLVVLWLYVLWGLICGRYKALYTPYTHYWNIVFILTFRCFGLRSISTVHDGIPHTGEGNWWERMINYATLRRSSHLIFLTEHVQRFLKSKVGFKARCSVIPHGLIEVEGVQVKEKVFEKPLSLLFLGRVCHYKGVDLLLDALKDFQRDEISKLVISGEVSYDQRHLMELKINLPVIWRDRWVSEAEMADDLNSADVLVLPYREATQSGVVSIGFSSGTPMICSRTGGLIEQCLKEECVFVEPTPESIAAGIRVFLNSPNTAQALQEAMKLKRENLTWDSISKEISACIDKTILT